ncbi:30S ribosomal protein S2 [Candidatus Saccharibacteria bacterium]|nr:30S ribosomal protein S2 [Candidatus Saccharibacteria bacterium]
MATVDVDIKKLLEAGAHFGHKTSRWHPKMSKYIHSKRDGNHIIDLTMTVDCLNTALEFIESQVAEGKQVLLVGTKRQAHDLVKNLAEETNMPYVVERWLGGMLTNRNTMNVRIKYLKDLENKMETGQLANKYNKLEVQRFQEEIDEMNHVYGGIKDMAARPGVMFVIDVIHENNAVREANKLGIPLVAVVDTNADPTDVQYPIPANDDAIKTISLITSYLKEVIESGKAKYAKKAEKETPKKDDKKGGEK